MKKIIFFTLAFSVIGIQAGIDQQLVDGINQKNLDMVQQALNRGVEINATDAQGKTALHNAVMQNDPEVVRMLLEKGANPNIRNNRIKRLRPEYNRQKFEKQSIGGETPLMLSTNPNISKLLLKYNTDVNISDYWGRTPLMFAVKLANPEIVKIILEKKPNLNAKTSNVSHWSGETALHYAARAGDSQTVRLLLDAGADPLLESKRLGAAVGEPLSTIRLTPSQVASTEEIKKILQEAEAKIKEQQVAQQMEKVSKDVKEKIQAAKEKK